MKFHRLPIIHFQVFLLLVSGKVFVEKTKQNNIPTLKHGHIIVYSLCLANSQKKQIPKKK